MSQEKPKRIAYQENAMPSNCPVRYDGDDYNSHSVYQRTLSRRLIERIDFHKFCKALDVGCGNGIVTLDLWQSNLSMYVKGIDISSSQIRVAKENFASLINNHDSAWEYQNRVVFEVRDICEFNELGFYDLVFSNFALHWLSNPVIGYQRIFDSMDANGELFVQQGCKGGLSGLHAKARKAIRNLGLSSMYEGWKYPRWSPSADDVYELLTSIGFIDVDVELIEEVLPKSEELIEDFVVASLIFYKRTWMSDSLFANIVEEFRRLCDTESYDSCDCNLIIHARISNRR